jgi:hypothetical protein
MAVAAPTYEVGRSALLTPYLEYLAILHRLADTMSVDHDTVSDLGLHRSFSFCPVPLGYIVGAHPGRHQGQRSIPSSLDVDNRRSRVVRTFGPPSDAAADLASEVKHSERTRKETPP